MCKLKDIIKIIPSEYRLVLKDQANNIISASADVRNFVDCLDYYVVQIDVLDLLQIAITVLEG